MVEVLARLYTHFGVHMPPLPTPHFPPPEPAHTYPNDKDMSNAIVDMVVQIVRETLED